MTQLNNHVFVDTLRFVLAGILATIMTLLSMSLVLARTENRRHDQEKQTAKGFLAEKHRALYFYRVFSVTYDVLNPPFYTREMRSKIVNLIGEGIELRVLDVGCGTGYTTRGILTHKNVCEVVGVDMNPAQLGKAAKNLCFEKKRVALSRGDAEDLPFAENAFDAVVSVGAIEYFPNPERAVGEMSRVVRPGGIVILGGPELAWFRKVRLDKFFYTPSRAEIIAIYSKANVRPERAFFTGMSTAFGTSSYVAVVAGRKSSSFH